MQNKLRIALIAGAAIIAAACASDMATSPAASRAAVAALASPPISFDQIRTSFVGRSNETDGFVPGVASSGGDNDGDHQQGGDGPGWGGLMGGGLSEAWIGGIGFGPGLGRGPFDDFDDSNTCTFVTPRVECAPVIHDGLTVTRSFSFLDAAGVVEQAFDAAKTDKVDVQNTVTGTVTHHSTATSTVNSSSDFTITGLASPSTQRTIDGTASGSETTTGTRDGVAFTAMRTASDITSSLVIPIQNGRPTYPTSGTVTRSMEAKVTLGSSSSTSSRKEVITYNGTATANVMITHDGVTKTCTKPLPHGRLTCA
jgi:hypothetical protein